MPKQVLPSAAAFKDFFTNIERQLSCKKVRYEEIRHWIEALPTDRSQSNTTAKKTKTGTETCYVYDKKNSSIRVVIWTTYVAGNEFARESDAGWVLLIDKRYPDSPIFYSFPIHRTKNFLHTLRKYINAFVALVNTWPAPCAVCGAELTIRNVKGGDLLQYAFACPNKHKLEKYSLYQNLPKANRLFLESRFRNYAKYRAGLAEEGIVRTPRVFIRGKVASPNSQVDKNSGGGSQINPLAEQYPFNDLQYEDKE